MFARTAQISLLALGVAVALAAGDAHAAAFQLKDSSAKAEGRAYAGEGSAPNDVSVVANNPAAMIGVQGTQFQANVAAIDFSAKFSGQGTYPTGAPISGGNGGDAGGLNADPSLYFKTDLGSSAHFGVSLGAPFGLPTEYDKSWKGRYEGTKTKLTALDLGAAFSFDVNPYVSFGAGVFAERLDISLSQAIDFGAALANNPQIQQQVGAAVQQNPQLQAAAQQAAVAAATQVALGGGSAAAQQAAAQQAGAAVYQQAAKQQLGAMVGSYDGYTTIKGNDTAVGYTLGTLLSPDDHTHIGFSYHSKVKHDISNGKASYEYPSGNVGTTPAAALIQAGGYINAGGKASISMPASATASFTHDFGEREQWSFMADVTFTAWKTALDKVTVQYDPAQNPVTGSQTQQAPNTLAFGYRNTTFASLGWEYRASDALTYRFGAGYDETPTTDQHRDVRVPDNSRKLASLGLSWNITPNTSLDAGYTHFFVKDSTVNEVSQTQSTLVGTYSLSADVLAVGATIKF